MQNFYYNFHQTFYTQNMSLRCWSPVWKIQIFFITFLRACLAENSLLKCIIEKEYI